MSTITKEFAQDIIKGHGYGVAPSAVEALARLALAALDSEPVAYTDDRNLGYIDRGRETAYLWGKQNSEAGDVPLYRHAQPSLVPDKMIYQDGVLFVLNNDMSSIERGAVAMRAWNACRSATQDAQPVPEDVRQALSIMDDEIIAELDAEESACRAAMLNHPSSIQPNTDAAPGTEIKHPSSNSPVNPEGYVMVPKEPTAEMVIKMRYHVGGYDRNIKEGYKAMLAAADCSIPMISDRWIPVSKRMPTKQDGSVFLTWNGQYIGKELFLMGSFQCLKPEIITHWMQLPAAPQEVKSES